MNGDITIDVGSAVPYALERILRILGKDSLTNIQREKLNRQIRLATEEAAWIQCVGMDRPIPIDSIYQPTRLVKERPRKKEETIEADIWSILEEGSDAIIFAGPGHGKTTLLHWMYYKLLRSETWFPILYTLRWPNAIEDLSNFVEEIETSNAHKRLKNNRIALLVDGYDEISIKDRKRVSAALRAFANLELGNFYLACRTFYDVIDLKAAHYHIGDFTSQDALGFVTSFSKIYGANLEPAKLLRELDEHGFQDFYSRPLMLALVCILKSGPLPQLPRNTIGLIRRAIDTLTFRWDESKGLSRDTRIALDGEERVRCLMRIAFHLSTPLGRESDVLRYVSQHLKLIQRQEVDVHQLLMETAQWYGMFIPTSEAMWTFVHRTIHDYLAARYWVESGGFSKFKVTDWNTRAAYAACLVHDATPFIEQALREEESIHAFTECLYNNAPIEPSRIAEAVIDHFNRYSGFRHERDGPILIVETSQDFFSLASDELISALIYIGVQGHRGYRKPAHDLVLAHGLREASRRKLKLAPWVPRKLRMLGTTGIREFRIVRKEGFFRISIAEAADDILSCSKPV